MNHQSSKSRARESCLCTRVPSIRGLGNGCLSSHHPSNGKCVEIPVVAHPPQEEEDCAVCALPTTHLALHFPPSKSPAVHVFWVLVFIVVWAFLFLFCDACYCYCFVLLLRGLPMQGKLHPSSCLVLLNAGNSHLLLSLPTCALPSVRWKATRTYF